MYDENDEHEEDNVQEEEVVHNENFSIKRKVTLRSIMSTDVIEREVPENTTVEKTLQYFDHEPNNSWTVLNFDTKSQVSMNDTINSDFNLFIAAKGHKAGI